MSHITENILEQTTLNWLAELGWEVKHGTEIAPDSMHPERENYGETVLKAKLKDSLARINPDIPGAGIDEAVKKITLAETPNLVVNNRTFHKYLTEGIDIELPSDEIYRSDHYGKVWLVDIDDINNNDWLAVNQFTVIENDRNRRPDIVLFINGIPLGVVELKNPGDEKATIKHAYNQIRTYKHDIQSLFTTNEALVISDGTEAKIGTITSGWDWFLNWRTIDGKDIAPTEQPQLDILLKGVFTKKRFLDYILNFIVFEDDGSRITKKSAAYHQYWAVNKAVNYTFSACGIKVDEDKLIGRFPEFKEDHLVKDTESEYGDGTDHFGKQRIGVIWHTQGSGKSLLMTFYAGKVIRHEEMNNPTLVIITDRNDLDEQLFGTFSRCKDILRQTPVKADSRNHLQSLLQVASGGVVFTTIQKFFPEEHEKNQKMLSDRRNIVVIADEAHRSQYGFIKGFARHMRDALPNASFIGFTGTPIERDDKSTPAVFGNYIDKYDILQAVEDKVTVPIYYESRLAKIEMLEEEKPKIDPEFDEITEGEEETEKQKMRTKWAALEAMVGAEKRVSLVAEDLMEHFERRQETMNGKAMIVCMSRRICVDIYKALRKIKPEWHSEDDNKGEMKVVMTGSPSDEPDWQIHIRSKAQRERLAERFKDPNDDFKVVIVRDMWLTGFDCPSLHTMYVDKPMNGHNLMQTIARVNRVFGDKPGGLVVDYIGLAESLKRALADYTSSGGRGDATIDQDQAVNVLLEKYEVVKSMFHGFDYMSIINGEPNERLRGITRAMDFILALEEGKKRFLPAVTELSKAFALAVPHEKAIAIRDEVGFFQEVRSALVKSTGGMSGQSKEDMDAAIKQLVSKSIGSDEVIDIFRAAGMQNPDISILSDQFLDEVRQLPQKNLALEMLKKLINDEITNRSRKNIVQARSFSKMLEEAVKKYQNRAIESATLIEELIKMAKDLREAQKRGETLGLNDDEVAFYDALADNKSAREVMGGDQLKFIAQELVKKVRKSVSIDWTLRENARAQIRILVKKILRRYGYPPDLQKAATELVLQQTEMLCEEWV